MWMLIYYTVDLWGKGLYLIFICSLWTQFALFHVIDDLKSSFLETLNPDSNIRSRDRGLSLGASDSVSQSSPQISLLPHQILPLPSASSPSFLGPAHSLPSNVLNSTCTRHPVWSEWLDSQGSWIKIQLRPKKTKESFLFCGKIHWLLIVSSCFAVIWLKEYWELVQNHAKKKIHLNKGLRWWSVSKTAFPMQRAPSSIPSQGIRSHIPQ